MWGCDREALLQAVRFWGLGVRSLFEDVGSAIAFWYWECAFKIGCVRSLLEGLEERSNKFLYDDQF